MTRARAKLLQAKVNSLLSLCDFDTPLDGLLLHNHALCIIRYEEKNPQDGGAPADKTKNSLFPAVLPAPDPVLPPNATAHNRRFQSCPRTLCHWRYYRPRTRYYRAAVLPPPATATNRRPQRKSQDDKRYYRPGSGTTARPVLPVGLDRYYRIWQSLNMLIRPSAL